MLGVTNLLTPLSYANAATWYDALTNDDLKQNALRFEMPDRDVFLYAHTEPNTYFVRYHGNTGALWSMDDKPFVFDVTWTLDTHSFTKTWYSFSGWNEDQGGEGTPHEENAQVYKWTTDSGGIVEIFAQWKANGYNIVYDLNPGTWQSTPTHSGSHPSSLAYDETWTIANPDRVWYKFDGWTITGMDTVDHIIGWVASNVSTTGWVTGTEFKNLRATTGTVHFAAKWSPEEVGYKIEYYLQDLSGNYTTPYATGDFRANADEVVTLARNTYSGFTTPEVQTGLVNPDGGSVFRYDYVRESYILTLIPGTWVASVSAEGTVSDGGESTQTTGISFKFDEPVTVSFVLKDWYQTGTWSGYSGIAAGFNMPDGPITKEAYATTIPYTITGIYHWWQDSNSGAQYVTGYTVESDAITLPTMLYRANSQFSWWIGEGITVPQKTVTVGPKATWNKQYEAVWDCDDWYHSGTDQCIADDDTEYEVKHYQQNLAWTGYDYVESDNASGTTNTDAVWTGKSYDWFAAWQLSGTTQKIKWDGSTKVEVNYNRLSYAWTIEDVTGIGTSSAQGEHPAATSGEYKYWDTVTLHATTGDWYIFDYWTVEGPDGELTVTNSGSMDGATFVMPAWTVTITPHVKTHSYTISYELNGWDYTWDSNPGTYTVEEWFTLNNPERDDSIFLWWTWSNGSDPQTTVTIATWTVWDKHYEANWTCRDWYHPSSEGQSCEKNGYEIHVNPANGSGSYTVNSTYDEWTEIGNPSRVWYDFAWWRITDMSGNVTHYIGSTGDTTEATSASGVMGTRFKNLTVENWGEVNFTAEWTAKENITVEVYHYTENLSGGYTLQTGITYTTWVADSGIALADYQRSYVWFEYNSWYLAWDDTGWSGEPTATTIVNPDGSTKLYLYYTRNTYNVYLSGDEHVTNLTWDGPYKFKQLVEVEATVEAWYHFVRWERKADSGFVTPYSGS